jgi:ribonuclease HI
MDGNKRVQKSGVIKGSPQNSTDAEFKAVLIGIWYAYMHGARDILVQTDCLAVVEILRGDSNNGQAKYRAQLADARAAHFPECSLRSRHVKGHTTVADARSYVNRWCDNRAGIAMRAERKNRLGEKPSKSLDRRAATKVRGVAAGRHHSGEQLKAAALKLLETGNAP